MDGGTLTVNFEGLGTIAMDVNNEVANEYGGKYFNISDYEGQL